MVDIICALCGQKQQVKTLYPATFKERDISDKTYSARRLPDKIHYRILKCKRCGLVFSSPIFTPEQLSKFYRTSLCNYDDQIPYLIKTYFGLVKQLKSELPKNPKVLEVGCGDGFFLKALVDKGFTNNVFGVEPSSKMVAQANPALQRKIKIDVFKKTLFPKNTFDLVLCFHTFDHMFDPNEFVQGAYAMLRKGGYIVVVVHDTQGLSVKLFGEKSAIFDIEHIYLFNKKTLREIFAREGFKVKSVFSLVNSYPLDYWVQMSGFPKFIKNSAKSVLNLLKISKKEVAIPAGNIALIAKKNI
jgi:SAM-dependent methyltransferase